MTNSLAAVLESVLVANRGEIALRVMRACRKYGVRTIAIYTDLDVDAPHVRAADDAVHVSSYLDIDAVVAAAVASGATAVHPGYGFLSERSAFVRAVEAAGVVFVGPPADVMDKMGRKDAAREIAVAAGVPVVPRGEDAGFPVLVKAAAGGGGKGMRVVREEADLEEAKAAAAREALAAFGDDTLLIEKYVERGRHIEVQIMADAHGHVVHLDERDCSTQRRHQKVLEEAPAPTISPEVRELVTSSAVALAKQVGYVNAGTVEFLVDDDTGEAYFLEMNTRLQVEHPVTELIHHDLDLVLHQLLVALGHPLEIEQDNVRPSGHAIEARVYAEDSFGGFLPQAGRTSIVRWPAGVRVDHALEPDQVVSTSYDPMLGKVIVHGPDRESARRALVDALDRTAILGLTTNVGFLRALVASEEFRDAAIDTAWLDRNSVPAPDDDLPRVFVAWVSAMLAAGHDSGQPFRADGWRSGADPAPTIVELDRPVVVDRFAGLVDGRAVRQVAAADHVLTLEVDGRVHSAVVNVQPHVAEVVHHGQRFVFERPDVFGDHAVDVGDGAIAAPMPGTVLDVRVEPGATVVAGDVLGVLEAMKMELTLKAPFDGTVSQVGATIGAQVALGARLFVVEPHAEAEEEEAG
ncbi:MULTISPECIES: biotin carboxylase N-terminal domain-containing protein [unclassified Nocardioides]|uniref:acetyl/propionyl/methylcrotonyl-CoA carboxylase subunit alpha n=1 Tax=unclassified Nocardioides TaxID=2615069 RepID=UPI0000570B51|nr:MULTISPECIES: biotin carboxylase N-terminal domain-containing protein [unclassified Nocardioides]ABL79693.1 Carbamoyl-phosphate synthase L chain, ATP-binding protein [Nocardioides sp. JS614]